MPLGIRPINDFAFKKTFGTPENRVALMSLLNAILQPAEPIVQVTLENPFNLRDCQDDMLSILDIKAVDRSEMLSPPPANWTYSHFSGMQPTPNPK